MYVQQMVTIIDPHIKRDGNYFIHKVSVHSHILLYLNVVSLLFLTAIRMLRVMATTSRKLTTPLFMRGGAGQVGSHDL